MSLTDQSKTALLSKLRAPVADEQEHLNRVVRIACQIPGSSGDKTARLYDELRAALASAPVADESPMAKMADALREKARQEQQAYQDRRNQATEWGPMPEGTEADRPIPIAPVAHVAGDETSRYLEWAKDRSAWEMPVGTPVYYSALASAPVAGEADQDEMERQGWVNIGYKYDLEKARRAISFCNIPGFDTMSLDNAIYWLRAKVDDAAPQASEAVRDAVEICPECDIAGCRHILLRALSAQPGAQKKGGSDA